MLQGLAQQAVGADAPGDDEVAVAGFLPGAAAFDGKGFNDGLLEGGGYVGAGLRVVALFFDEQAYLGFETAEAEVHAGAVGHRPR